MRFYAWVMLAFVFVACGSDPEPKAATSTAIEYKLPTATATATPTSTPTATPTPEPTATPIPPTATPKPLPKPVQAQPQAQSNPVAEGYTYVEQCGQSFRNTVARWIDLVSQYAWNLCAALRIIDCESGGQEYIFNMAGSGACGLWQHLPCEDNGDGVASTARAWLKYSGRGWQPWSQCT